jgi:hypothetical protein
MDNVVFLDTAIKPSGRHSLHFRRPLLNDESAIVIILPVIRIERFDTRSLSPQDRREAARDRQWRKKIAREAEKKKKGRKS